MLFQVVVTNHVKEDHLNTAVTPALGKEEKERKKKDQKVN